MRIENGISGLDFDPRASIERGLDASLGSIKLSFVVRSLEPKMSQSLSLPLSLPLSTESDPVPMSSIARWNAFEDFEKLARLSDEAYRRAAAIGIAQHSEEIQKRQREIEALLNGVGNEFEFGEYQFHVFKDWCDGFRGMIQATNEPDWNPCAYEPNCEILSALLEDVKSKSTKDKVDTLVSYDRNYFSARI